MDGLKQRGAALLHQVVGVIVNNTDVVLLTVCLGSKSLIEVSVYGIYNMVIYAMNLLLTSFSNGLTAGFGEVISKGEKQVLRDSYSNYEYTYMIILMCVCTCMGVLLLPFVSIYTLHVTDADYIRPFSAILFTLSYFCRTSEYRGSRSYAPPGILKRRGDRQFWKQRSI